MHNYLHTYWLYTHAVQCALQYKWCYRKKCIEFVSSISFQLSSHGALFAIFCTLNTCSHALTTNTFICRKSLIEMQQQWQLHLSDNKQKPMLNGPKVCRYALEIHDVKNTYIHSVYVHLDMKDKMKMHKHYYIHI